MKKGTPVLMGLLCLVMTLQAQQKHHRQINSLPIDAPIKVDSKLDEAAWAEAEEVSRFITWAPSQGLEPANQEEVKLLYDDNSIYLGAFIKEHSREIYGYN